ncbi:hypothetical protein SAMN05421505_15223 [Sinosporangium album]|uniref:Uncharacterized protein n=1 Tax=Sinosporangium album TaxID=504805 RepID=A0A1G8KMA7_9ACTN|nr:hypothetical protein SAMN05421505_15223 [Sinosporangium album]
MGPVLDGEVRPSALTRSVRMGVPSSTGYRTPSRPALRSTRPGFGERPDSSATVSPA